MKNKKTLIGVIALGLAMGMGVFFWQDQNWFRPQETVQEQEADGDTVGRFNDESLGGGNPDQPVSSDDDSQREIDYGNIQKPAPGTPGTVSVIEQAPEIIEAYEAAESLAAEELVGDWSGVEGFYESITLRADGSFDAYLHDRPFVDGEWFFEDGSLTLDSSAGVDLDTQYSIIRLDNDVLTLYRSDDPDDRDVWERNR